MSRFIAILLIPICLLGQPLPHGHSESRTGKSGHSDGRAHFHLGHSHSHGGHGHHCHHHHDETPANQITSAPDHGDDAVYIGDFRASGALKKIAPPKSSVFTMASWEPIAPSKQGLAVLERAHPPNPVGDLPVYLLTMSLRI